jgi:hypothetical protein
MMKSFFEKRVHILVDEYDAGIMNIIQFFLISKADDRDNIKQVIQSASKLITGILRVCSKGADDYVEKIVMTGVT